MNQRYSTSTKSLFSFGILTLLLWFSTGSSLFAQNLQISGGNSFSVALCDNKFVYAWGLNNVGQFGLNVSGVPNPLSSSSTPQKVYYKIPTGLPSAGVTAELVVKQVDAGSGSHAIALACDGLTYVWGETTCGQNGIGQAIPLECECGSSMPQPGPKPVLAGAADAAFKDANGYLIGVVYVSGANNASFVILSNGEVMAWGENSFGQLGNGNVTDQALPVYVTKADGTRLTNIVQIEGGDRCTYALDASGQVWSWGLNSDNKELGRATLSAASGTLAAAPTCATYITNRQYDPRAGRVEAKGGGFLTGITQISGGDTHGLGLSGTGEVWSWGGNWGSGGTPVGGQLGWGATLGYTPGAYADKVVAPGNLVNQAPPYLSNVVYVAAGQASSAAVLGTGEVVVWGSNGFSKGCGLEESGIIANGVMGAGGTCPATAGNKGIGVPTYVKINSTTNLTGISRISDGDAWYFAQGTSGNFAFGYNTNGESAIAGNTNHNLATTFNLPAGCVLGDPCPIADLPADYSSCPVFSDNLYAGSTGSTYVYTWYWKTTNGPWTAADIIAGPTTGPLGDNITANKIGYYRVVITDPRPSVAGSCTPCPPVEDVIHISEILPTWTGTACSDAASGLARFTISPNTKLIKWYKDPTGGTALNPSNTSYTITVPFASTNTTIPGCGRALFAEDIESFPGTLLPATTIAGANAVTGCATNTYDWDNTGDNSMLLIEVTQTVTITEMSALVPSGVTNGQYAFTIWNNNATGGPYCGSCTPPGNKDGKGTLRYTSPALSVTTGGTAAVAVIPGNHILNPGKYWIGISGSGGQVGRFDCTRPSSPGANNYFTTSYVDNSGSALMYGRQGLRQGNIGSIGSAFNIKFNFGSPYPCGRLLVCVSGTCVLPVELVNFQANRVNGFNLITWSTASEKNNARFDIQRSSDGVNFTTIGKVDGNGNSSSLLNYSFKDYADISGTVYYRLAQYDYDGTLSLSETRVVIAGDQAESAALTLYPNPNKGSFTVAVSGVSGNVRLNVLSAVGQSVLNTVTPSEGSLEQQIDLTAVSKGVYFVTVTTDTKSWTEKVIIE